MLWLKRPNRCDEVYLDVPGVGRITVATMKRYGGIRLGIGAPPEVKVVRREAEERQKDGGATA